MVRLRPCPRRAFLTLAAGALVAAAVKPARAASRVRALTRDSIGTTINLELDHAPFPAPGAPYQDATVIAFVPAHFRLPRDGRAPMLVHFHGHNTAAERSLVAHQLREQLFDSRQNAILVAPQGPLFAPDSAAGKLESPGGLARMLRETLDRLASPPVAAALGPAAIGAGAQPGTVCLSAHSGGYHAAACAVKSGGIDVNELYLFDALYADVETFKDWVAAGKGKSMRSRHKLVSYFGPGTTEANSRWLHAELTKLGVSCAFEDVEGTLSREELVRAEAVFVHSGVGHSAITHELNALRDCLYASGLPRRLRTAWFDASHGARRLERR
jgi:hypothetical protein